MEWIDQTVEDFGRSLGIDRLGFTATPVIQLAFDRTGTLVLERAGGAVVVYLARRLPLPLSSGLGSRALELCHPRHGHPFAYAAGFRGDDTLIFLVRIPETEFTLPTLQRAFDGLVQLHDTMAA